MSKNDVEPSWMNSANDSPTEEPEPQKPRGWGGQIYDAINNSAKAVDGVLFGGYDEAIKNGKSILSFGTPRISLGNAIKAPIRMAIATTRFVASAVKNTVAYVAYGTYHAAACVGHTFGFAGNLLKGVGHTVSAMSPFKNKLERTAALKNAGAAFKESARHLKETIVSGVIGGATVAFVGLTAASAGLTIPVASTVLGSVGPVIGPAIAKFASPILSHADKLFSSGISSVVGANQALTSVATVKAMSVTQAGIVGAEAGLATTVAAVKTYSYFKKNTPTEVTNGNQNLSSSNVSNAKPMPQSNQH